jgi:hypothetical protein
MLAMAEEKNSGSGGVLALLLLGGFVAYEMWKAKQPAAVLAGDPVPPIANAGATTLSNVNYPSSGTTAPSLTNPQGIPVVQNPDNGISLPPGITQTQWGIVNACAMSGGNIPPWAALVAAQVPADYATVVDLWTNVWTTTGVPTPAQAAAWQALVMKYDPQRKYW